MSLFLWKMQQPLVCKLGFLMMSSGHIGFEVDSVVLIASSGFSESTQRVSNIFSLLTALVQWLRLSLVG